MSYLFDLSDISYAYPGRPQVLKDANLQLSAGERVCLTGFNGAGKSTLLQIMVGLIQPDTGSVTAFGKVRAVEKDFIEVRHKAGYVFQDPDDQLFCPTVLEDVAFGPLNMGRTKDQAREIVAETLETIGIADFANRVTHKLSGGEKRLVSLACVLAMQPEVLLLDEPTNALDEVNFKRLISVLDDLPQAMVIVSHDAHFRRALATRTVVLQDGAIVAHDPACRHAARN